MPDKPVLHGNDHGPGGMDTGDPGAWIYVAASPSAAAWNAAFNYSPGDVVGDGIFNYMCILATGPATGNAIQPGVTGFGATSRVVWPTYWTISQPVFQSGWANVGGTKVPMRFRISVGHYNVLDRISGDVASPGGVYSDHQVEIQGDCIGGLPGTVVFVIPPAYRLPYDVPIPSHDSSGLYIPTRLYVNGNYVWAVA